MSSYAASHGDGPRFPMVNRRVTPTEAGEYVIMTDIVPIVEFPDNVNIGYCRLKERPVTAYGGVGMVVKNYNTNVVYSGSITWPPQPETFYVSPYLGRVYFHSSAIGESAAMTYSGMGTIVDAVDMNHVNDKADQAANPGERIVLPANGSITVQDKIAVAVYGIEDGGSVLTLNPSFAQVRVHDFTDPDTCRTEIVNSSAQEKEVYIKFNKHFEKDR